MPGPFLGMARLYDLHTLPSSLLAQLGLLNLMDGDPPQGRRFIDRARRLGYPASSYFAVYAVEGGRIRSRIETLELPFRAGGRSQRVVGITGVVTDPESVRHGLARSVLEEIHRRERRAGRAWSFLWTHRTWGAHRLYEKLGYRDVFFPPSAARRAPGTRAGHRTVREFRLRTARARDAVLLERLLATSTRGRWGFLPRYPGSFRLKFELGWRQPENHLILLRRGIPVGYAHVSSNKFAVAVNEVVTTRRGYAVSMVETLERAARTRWLAFVQTTFASDHADWLEGRGYAVLRSAHLTLMAAPLTARWDGKFDPRAVCRGAAFSCHRGDVF